MLHLWVEKNRENATGNVLEKALKCIRRDDIIHKCIRTLEKVTDVTEKQAAKAQLVSLGKYWHVHCMLSTVESFCGIIHHTETQRDSTIDSSVWQCYYLVANDSGGAPKLYVLKN